MNRRMIFSRNALIDKADHGNDSDEALNQIKEMLESKQFDIHYWQDKALRAASSRGNLRTVKLLVEYGADVTAKNNEPIESSYFNGHGETTSFLVSKGANLKKILYSACSRDDVETIKFMKKKNINIHEQNELPFLNAVINSRYSFALVKYFIRDGTDVNVRNSNSLKITEQVLNNNNSTQYEKEDADRLLRYLLQEGGDLKVLSQENQEKYKQCCTHKISLFFMNLDKKNRFNKHFMRNSLCDLNLLSLVFQFI